MPSICYEVFGIIILEAFTQKTPVIVNDLGALSEVVAESGGGFTYKSQQQLVEAMDRLRGDSQLRAELGQRGHQAYLARWSKEPHLRMYRALIESTARRKFGITPWERTTPHNLRCSDSLSQSHVGPDESCHRNLWETTLARTGRE